MQKITEEEHRIYKKVRLAYAADDCIETLNRYIDNQVQFVASKDPDKKKITEEEQRIYEKARLAHAADECIEMLNLYFDGEVQLVAGKDPDKIYDYVEEHLEEISQNFLHGLLGDDDFYRLQSEWWYSVLNEAIKNMPTN